MLSIRTILHPTDFSDSARDAFRLACALARDYGARLVLLHVGRQPVIQPFGGVIPPEPEQYHEELAESLCKIEADDPKVCVERRLIFGGDPAVEIVQVARQIPCDLIVLGTHGRTGLGHLLMGSVAERVVRAAPCPVVAVKSPRPASSLPAEPSGLRRDGGRELVSTCDARS
jgi:nucleotide-binding universal stress UspA family protein